MAALRPQRGRTPLPTLLSPHPKPTISLEEWEAKAPLTDLEQRSVHAVKRASEIIPLPLKFSAEDGFANSRPATPLLRTKLATSLGPSISRNGTPSPGSPTKRPMLPVHSLQPTEPIKTPQAFYDWFARVDRAAAHAQEAHFRAHLADVAEHLDTCDTLVSRLEQVDEEVREMLEEWTSVEEGGKNLKEACEKLLQERDELLELTDDIGFRLEYFTELEHATRMLNHPGESLVLQNNFLHMVERVDICIDYLKAHRHYREAEIYLLRFQQCMTRAMTLIKMFFVGSLRALNADVSKRISEKDVSATAQYHLLYTRFNTVAAQVAPLLRELERRARLHPESLSALLSECHGAYFQARRGLLVTRLMEEIRGLDPAHTELVELTRSGCGYLKQLCTDEFNLYRSFFNSGEEQLYQYLETLCDYLYDDLRPRILHEQRLTALCEVCTVLQALMVLDVPTFRAGNSPLIASSSKLDSTSSRSEFETDTSSAGYDSDSGSDGGRTNRGDELMLDFHHPGQRRRAVGNTADRLGGLQIAQLLQMVLQDAQTRLFFKAQSVVQAEIRHFVPKAEDLAYPDKIVEARKPAAPHVIREKESVSELFKLPSRERQDTWYPTLTKTIWVLSQLHDFVKPAIFEDIAQEAIYLCRQSLVVASENIKAKNTPTSGLDGALFLVRHLFILKDMTQNVDLSQRNAPPAAVGNSEYAGGMSDTLTSVLNRTSAYLPNALFASLGVPRADDNIGDAKLGIDQELKRACEDVIVQCSDTVARPLRDWAARVRVYTNPSLSSGTKPNGGLTGSNGSTALASQDWASLQAAEALDSSFRASCGRDLRGAATRVALYLEETRTITVLLAHVRERVVGDYATFGDVAKGLHGLNIEGKLMTAHECLSLVRRACEVNGVA